MTLDNFDFNSKVELASKSINPNTPIAQLINDVEYRKCRLVSAKGEGEAEYIQLGTILAERNRLFYVYKNYIILNLVVLRKNHPVQYEYIRKEQVRLQSAKTAGLAIINVDSRNIAFSSRFSYAVSTLVSMSKHKREDVIQGILDSNGIDPIEAGQRSALYLFY